MKRRCELVDAMMRIACLRRWHDPPDRVSRDESDQHHHRGMPPVAAMHAAQRTNDAGGADQRENDRRVERDRPEPVGGHHPSTILLAAQIHARHITDVSTTSLGQWAPRATRATQPSISIIDAAAKTSQRAGVFVRRAASTATAPKVTQKNVIVVDGNV